MKLDPRIKSVSDILTPYDTEKAEQFIGQKGFFANSIDYFREGEPHCVYGTLTRVFGHKDQAHPFQNRDGYLYSFFLPESSIMPTGKKYRPYTLWEFQNNFAVGSRVKFRAKGGPDLFLTLDGYGPKRYKGYTINYIYIGGARNTLRELFDGYERYDDTTGSWVPFGVEVEE